MIKNFHLKKKRFEASEADPLQIGREFQIIYDWIITSDSWARLFTAETANDLCKRR